MMRLYKFNIQEAEPNLIKDAQELYLKEPMELLKVTKSDSEFLTAKITAFLKEYLKTSGLKGYVIGLSGGIDSSVCATLAVKAVGSENVFGMLLPSKFTAQRHIDDALKVAVMLNIKVNDYGKVRATFDKVAELTMSMTEVNKDDSKYKIVLANNHARERMKILRGKAQQLDYLVLGTTNMTEAWLGYATIAGDGYKGIDIEPIQMLPKTSERMYAKFLGIPEQIITKAPTAGLWDGQTDESEIGLSYEYMDRIMVGYFLSRVYLTDHRLDKVEIHKLKEYEFLKEKTSNLISGLTMEDIIKSNNKPSITKESIDNIIRRVKKNAFKANPEPFADLSR